MSHSATFLLLVATVAGGTACSDSPLNPLDGNVTVARAAGDSQTAIVNSPVAMRPAVLVTNQNHQPVRDATVAFKVMSGGGSVTDPSVTTDSLGIATVGGWILGKTVGENTLLAVTAPADSVTFTATAISGPPAQLTKAYTTLLTATVGSAVAMPPAVRVTDAYGNPSAGVAVTFAVSAGGGSATGLTGVTDSSGKAGVGAWIMGTVAGANTLTASVDGLPPLTLTASGVAGSPVSIAKQAGDGQMGSVSAPPDTAPAVVVKDAYGNPVSNAFVAFDIVSGGGELNTDSRFTDRTGTATAAWVLGPLPGTNTLRAAVANLAPVFFTVMAEDYCEEATPYTIGSTVSAALSVGTSCRIAGEYEEYADLYATSTAAPISVRFDMSSSAFSSHPSLFDADGMRIASGPYWCDRPIDPYCSTGTLSVRVLLGVGDYVVTASGFTYDTDGSPDGRVVGSYVLSSTLVPEDVTSCELVFILRSATTAQRIDATDCKATFQSSSYFSDRFALELTAGQTYTISMSSAEFDTYLELRSGEWGNTVAFNNDFGGSSNSQITFTPTSSGRYVIKAATFIGDTTGAYTLVVQ